MDCLLCDGHHDTMHCSYPTNLFRCDTCGSMVMCHEPHSCRTRVSSFRIQAIALDAKLQFNMRNTDSSGEILIYNIDNALFESVRTHPCAATGGLLQMRENGTISYSGTKEVRFSFYVALLSSQYVDRSYVALRAIFVPNEGILFAEGNMGIEAAISNSLNTSFLLGIRPKTKCFRLQFKSLRQKTISVAFVSCSKTTKWKINFDRHVSTNRPPADPHHRQVNGVLCHNCGGQTHCIENCRFPNYTEHCRGCLVASTDGTGHQKPCKPINKISMIRSNIFVDQCFVLYEWFLPMNDISEVYYLDDGSFVELRPNTTLLSAPTESLIVTQMNEETQKQCIVFKQISFKRCSVLIAILDKNKKWRLRFRVMVTPAHGLLVFPITKEMEIDNRRILIPQGDISNAVQLIGITLKQQSFYGQFRVHANRDGRMGNDFSGYHGHIGVDISSTRDTVLIDDHLHGSQNQPSKKFNINLYKDEPRPLSDFKSQQNVAPIAWVDYF